LKLWHYGSVYAWFSFTYLRLHAHLNMGRYLNPDVVRVMSKSCGINGVIEKACCSK